MYCGIVENNLFAILNILLMALRITNDSKSTYFGAEFETECAMFRPMLHIFLLKLNVGNIQRYTPVT